MFRPNELPVWFAGHTYQLKKIVGTGGMAVVYGAEVDIDQFDFAQLVAHHEAPRGGTRELRRSRRIKRYEMWRERTQSELRAVCDRHNLPYPKRNLVAVKILLPSMEDHVPRFEAEWESLLTLDHPNLIEVYGGGVDPDEDLHYYAMELLVGRMTLAQTRELPLARKLSIIRQAAEGLACLHERNLIHRDIKPGNIICCRSESGDIVAKVADLGVAKDLARTQALTATGQMLGTPNFMAPEQIDTDQPVTPLVDVYALGATLYYFCCGQMPYEGRTVMEIFGELARGEPPVSLAALTGGRAPEMLTMLVETMMALNPRHRPPGTRQVVRAIDRFCEIAGDGIEMATSVIELPPAKRLRRQARERFEELLAVHGQTAVPGEGGPPAEPETSEDEPEHEPAPSTPRTRRRTRYSPALLGWIAGGGIALVATVIVWIAVSGSSVDRPPQPREIGQREDAPPRQPARDGLAALVDRTRRDVQAAIVARSPRQARASITELRIAMAGHPDRGRHEAEVDTLEQDLEREVDRLFAEREKAFRSWLDARDLAHAQSALSDMVALETPRHDARIRALRKSLQKVRAGEGAGTRLVADFESDSTGYRALKSQIERVRVRQPGSKWALRWRIKSGTHGATLSFVNMPRDVSKLSTLRLWIRPDKRFPDSIELQLTSSDGLITATYVLKDLPTGWTYLQIPLTNFFKKGSWDPRGVDRLTLFIPWPRRDVTLALDDVDLTTAPPDGKLHKRE